MLVAFKKINYAAVQDLMCGLTLLRYAAQLRLGIFRETERNAMPVWPRPSENRYVWRSHISGRTPVTSNGKMPADVTHIAFS